jgi:pimeloyl-ACP methyl ester carboxylesterase
MTRPRRVAILIDTDPTEDDDMVSAQPDAAPAGDYVDAGGVHTYYEVAGQGEPLLLLHGGFSTIESWGAQTPALAERYRVYLPERRGHGRTPDVEGPTGFDIMARDTIAFMEALEISSAYLVGWSDGGNVGLEIALVRPDLVRKLVIIGAGDDFDVVQPDGPKYTAELRAQAQHLTPDALPHMLREAYEQLSPDGADHFRVVFEKLIAVYRSGPRHALDDLARISAPTLVMVGDDDLLTADHAAAIQRTIPDAQLAVVPGTDHLLQFEKPELVNRIILDFLAEKQAPKLFSEW